MTQQTLSQYPLTVIDYITTLVKLAIDSYKRSLEIKATIRELSRLSDKELNDIGISRGDIYAIAYGDTTHKKVVD